MPRTKRDVRRFLGFCAYFHRFVPNFSKIADPLQQLVKDEVAFVGGPKQSDAFRDHQQCLQTPLILGNFASEADKEVRTDANILGLGTILVQYEDGVERVIAYASRTLSSAEKNYSTTEK